MSIDATGDFRWRRRADDEIPDEVDLLIDTNEYEGPLVARSDGTRLWGPDGPIDWEQIRWWSHIPATPDIVILPPEPTART